MKALLSALTMTFTADDVAHTDRVRFRSWFWPLMAVALAWDFILTQMVFTYRNIEDWQQIVLASIYAFCYAGGFVFIVALLSAVFLIKPFGFTRSFYYGVLALTPVVVVALISLVMQIQFETIKVLGHFPEHPFIISAYLAILSQVRLVALGGKIRAIFYLLMLTALTYALLGPIMFELFKL